MNGFLYTITLEEPVLANSLGGEPNSARSLFYIPGGLVRGAVINAYQDKDANDDTFRSLFLNGDTRFLNAYPIMGDERALPIPLKFKKPKYFEAGNLGRLHGPKIDALEEEWQINVHTQRDAQKGRSTEASGAVYRYIALPAGMKFQGAVISENAKAIMNALKDQTILLGKARTAGYGKASITTEPLPVNWHEMSETPSKDVKEFTLVLLSSALVRNEDGQFTLDISTALSKRLARDIKPERIVASCKSEIVGGFNRTWGLPLPQSTAIAAGSVFQVTLENDITADELKVLENTGIGERRAEGFGSLAITASLPDKIEDDDWTPTTASQGVSINAGNLSAEDNQLAEMMFTRLLRRDLDQLIITKAREMTDGYKSDSVPGSQLSRWRVLLRDALAKGNSTQRIKDFYHAENKKRSPAFVKMEKTRIKFEGSPSRLTEWIEASLEDPQGVNKLLESAPTLNMSLGSDPIKLSEKLKTEYGLRLMDAVLSTMAKKNIGKGGKND